ADERAVSGVHRYTDDLHVASETIPGHEQMLPERRPVTEILLGKHFVDHGNGRRAGPVPFVEIAAREDGNLHRREESRSDGEVTRRWIGGLSGYVDRRSRSRFDE